MDARTASRWGSLTVLLATACSTQESRLWRISPLSGEGDSDPQRVNGWPLFYADRAGAAVLWPLMDVDRHGFAVRPLISRDDAQWDVLFPLSHFDADRGQGWALNAYRFQDNSGLFPLCNFGPSVDWFGPGFWCKDGGRVTNYGLLPIAAFDRERGNGFFLTAYSYHGNFGVFPLFQSGPDFDYAGPVWWTHDGDDVDHFGLFPIATFGRSGAFRQLGPVWWRGGDDACGGSFGVFPFVWSFDGGSQFVAAPFYMHDVTAEGSDRLLLVPPTWWRTRGAVEHHFVVPFYAHVAGGDSEFTAYSPFFAERTTPRGSQWFTPVANGWRGESPDARGLNVYPLYWSSTSPESTTNAFVPLWLYRERGDERSLVTPLGGRGWSASGATTFTNVLGPLYHHSQGGDRETTAFLWPLFERDRAGDEVHTRAFPFLDLTESPGRSDRKMLGGLARYVKLGESSSFRLWPLYAQSDAPETPDLLFDTTLVGRRTVGDTFSTHVFPLYWASGDESSISHTALLGVVRSATTPNGSAWRVLPLASSSTDRAAEGWLDRATLFRHERRDDVTRDYCFPLYWRERTDGEETDALLVLARHRRTKEGSATRVWPLVSTTDADGLDDFADHFTLIGVHPHREKTHVHVGTSLLFGLDTFGAKGEPRTSWQARALTFFTCGRDRRPTPVDSTPKEKPKVAEPSDATAPDSPRRSDQVVDRTHAGFFFDRFLVESRVVESSDGARHDESHLRVPFLHEYKSTPGGTEWDVLCWSVHSTTTPDEQTFSVLWKGYRSTTRGEQTTRDVFPFVTYDTDRDVRRFSFLWRLFHYERQGEKIGGHVLFVPWGDRFTEAERTARG